MSTTATTISVCLTRPLPPPSLRLSARHAQILGTLQAFMHWLSQLYLETLRNQEQPQLRDSLGFVVTTVVSSCLPLVAQHVPEKVVLSACQLFLSLTTTVRPKFLLSLPEVQTLMAKACGNELTTLPQRVSCQPPPPPPPPPSIWGWFPKRPCRFSASITSLIKLL